MVLFLIAEQSLAVGVAESAEKVAFIAARSYSEMPTKRDGRHEK